MSSFSPNKRLSQAARRIYWKVRNPNAADGSGPAITVLGEDLNPDGPHEDYFGGDASWPFHPISLEPITDEPVESIMVNLQHVGMWMDASGAFDESTRGLLMLNLKPPYFEVFLYRGELAGRKFVTIQDYISIIHPWITDHFTNILEIETGDRDDYRPNYDNEVLLVDLTTPDVIRAENLEMAHRELRERFEMGNAAPLPPLSGSNVLVPPPQEESGSHVEQDEKNDASPEPLEKNGADSEPQEKNDASSELHEKTGAHSPHQVEITLDADQQEEQ